MGANSLPKTVTRQRRDHDFNPGPSAPEFSTLTTRLPSYCRSLYFQKKVSLWDVLIRFVEIYAKINNRKLQQFIASSIFASYQTFGYLYG